MEQILGNLMQQILLQALPAISQTKVNRWLGTSVFTAMSTGVEGKGKIVTGQILLLQIASIKGAATNPGQDL